MLTMPLWYNSFYVFEDNLLIKVNIMLVLVHFTQFSMLQVCLMSFFHPLHHLIVKNNMKFSIMRRCKSCSARPFPLLAIPAPPRDGSLLALPLHTALVYTRHHRHHHHIHHGSWAENTIFISESCTNIGSGDSLGIGPKTSLSCQKLPILWEAGCFLTPYHPSGWQELAAIRRHFCA